ncbi:uncharacterized protein I303_102514 [Kwoniella dejecticola CBS 10117]|uniref:Uncharacterized protein n=1 Tax=Kwoniella dejecticola CBS 10117 TaxID=1296121 RepID=A0A1A6A8Y3_9TREE|nr:uncharacterized protein I303_02528 [Kwoniella dejecticola CBS 10117]OBR86520.1 hypothetical protein I303_02528 [Kwoniella dejecticola CBS 10117]
MAFTTAAASASGLGPVGYTSSIPEGSTTRRDSPEKKGRRRSRTQKQVTELFARSQSSLTSSPGAAGVIAGGAKKVGGWRTSNRQPSTTSLAWGGMRYRPAEGNVLVGPD